MIKITYKSKGSLKDIIPQLSDVKKALRLTGALYLQKQRGRIRAGQDVSGNAFVPYSEEYAFNKQHAGRKTQPDLRLTGDMLRSQKVKVSSIGQNSGQMLVEFDGERHGAFFKGSGSTFKKGEREGFEKLTVARTHRTVSNAVLAASNNRLRPFIGQTKKGMGRLLGFFLGELKKLMRRRSKTA
ncbi:MAG: hypothetical protein KAI66_25135 [Lentisphaeria bacterium]|nr:hypothetical protein [Lentisphaeria bacterium]